MTKKTNSSLHGSTPSNPSFEDALAELESIVSKIEAGQLPLEESLEAFKRGTVLSQLCQKTLSDVEQQISIMSESGQLQTYEAPDE